METISRLAFIFVDGLGIGSDRVENPLTSRPFTGLERFTGSPLFGSAFRERTESRLCARRIDACLGVEGLPQSGTGQATLFTGINCATIAGRHFGPFPHSRTRETIRQYNIFERLKSRRIDENQLAFVNAFPDRFFERARLRDRWTVTTRCCLDSGVRIRTIDDLRQNRALPADLSGDRLPQLGIEFDPVTAKSCGLVFADIVRRNRFTLFEYFLTDKAGHSMDPEAALVALQRLDDFVGSLLNEIREDEATIVLSSDHGNIEDLSVRTHTLNDVPLLAVGPGAPYFAQVNSLEDVTSACVNCISETSR